MDSTISKTYYTCSTESLFLRHKKISEKTVKLGSFLECSVIYFQDMMAASENLIQEFCETIT